MDIQKEIALNISIKLSEKICKKITVQTIRRLQKIDSKLEEVESLKNVWDDICYQRQQEMSNDWKYYSVEITSIVRSLVKNLESYELNAILLQLEDAQARVLETTRNMFVMSNSRQTIDFSKHEFYVSRYIVEKYIDKETMNWANSSLRNAVRISQY